MLIPYQITCKCGHTINYNIDAHLLIADQIAKYFIEQGACEKCRHEQLKTENAK